MRYLKYLVFMMLLMSCNFIQEVKDFKNEVNTPEFKQASKEIFQQNIISQFNYTIAIIELYNTRHGKYPETLDSLKYLSYWDRPARFDYKLLEDGYALNAIYDTINKMSGIEISIEEINIPASFWNGIGLKESNLKK